MGVETQQLADILEEIKGVFAQHPSILVTPIKGDPPEQYEVQYTVKGIYKDEGGRIQHSLGHTITITIPFGFPHFPPSCKPKTAIFHPDFDPAAICLGDFWQQERSLSDLIIYIGRMIAGELYSKENAFNEEAAVWYRENSDKLPFARLTPLDAIKSQPETPLSTSLAETIEIDTLEDSDFTADFNFLGLERESGAEQKPPSPSEPLSQSATQEPEFDVETIWLLSRQKRFNQLKDILKNLPKNADFEGKGELSERIEIVFAEARQIYNQGEDLEHQGLPAKALEKYIAVEELVSDYPRIHENIRRTEQSKDLLGDWVQNNEDSSPEISKSREKKRPDKAKGKEKVLPAVQSSKSAPPTLFTEKNKRQINLIPLVIIAGLLIVISPLVYIYISNTSQYNRAEQLYSECANQVREKHFEAASKSCGSALSLAKEIIFVKRQASTELSGKIDTLLNSEELRQGLAGNVLVNGTYVPQAVADALKNSQNIVVEGDKLMSESKWKKAIEVYSTGLQAFSHDPTMDPALRLELEKKIHLAQINLSIQDGQEAMSNKKWQQARKKFEEAQTETKYLKPEEQQLFSAKIQPQIDRCSFLLLKQQGDEMFANSDWTGAFALFQQAISLGSKLDQSETKTLGSLQGDIIRAELYATINEGKDAFSSGQWDEAIKKYAKASKILMDNSGLLNQADTDMNRQKLARIMLQASIIRDRQEADRLIEETKYSDAENSLQLIMKAINTSPLGKEKEFQTVLNEARETIAGLQEKQYVSEKIQYLEANFQTLFSENYPAAAPDTLSSPVITYVKDLKDKLLFKMQCTENGQGRPLKLVMFYTYSKTTDQWAFYSNTE